MRVALIAPLFESVPPRLYGGTERVVANLCRGLTEADIEVTLFASGDSCVEGQVIPVVEEALRLSRKRIRDPVPYSFRMLTQVADRADEFDLIHNHNDFWMLPLSRMTRTPFLSTLHGRLDVPDIPAAFMSFADIPFVSISDSQRSPLGLLNWVRTIHHGIDVESYEFHAKPGKYLAFLGRISMEKRPDWAIQIAREAGIPLKIAAKIEGPGSQEYFDEAIRPLIDGHNVEFVGEISEAEKSEFLGEALALVFPIDWPEPFGLVMIEALACGTPVLARPCGAVSEILEDGVTGFVSSDLTTLARKARDVASIKRERCRAWVSEKFSLKRMTEDYIDVYRELAGSARRAFGDRRNLLHSV